jgi:AcrR family transcriptional regulator
MTTASVPPRPRRSGARASGSAAGVGAHAGARSGAAPPRSGRRSRKRERTRREIFEAAMALFAERGFAGVTIEQICAAADVARGTFFLHFPAKGALLFEFNRKLAAELSDRLREPRGTAVSEYRTMVDLFGARWLEHSDVMGAMLRELLVTPEAVAGAAAEGEDLRHVVEDIVRRGQQRGEFRSRIAPRLAASMFLTTSAAILSGAVFAPGEASPEEIRNQLLHAVLHGLLEPKPRLKWQSHSSSTAPAETPR